MRRYTLTGKNNILETLRIEGLGTLTFAPGVNNIRDTFQLFNKRRGETPLVIDWDAEAQIEFNRWAQEQPEAPESTAIEQIPLPGYVYDFWWRLPFR